MPIYEYRCENGHLFEVMQKFTDPPVTECEVCGAPVARVFHPVAVHFKGKGFYNTDYGTQKRAREQESQKAAEGGSDSAASADGSSKPTQNVDGAKSEAAKPAAAKPSPKPTTS
ncbi:MAG TPA: FmdB family zinc ribbon protein [Solirubrobacteraceae bacterium]|nr:FmdB family zinc ribbon protein [Solirubrobacteraceae bacterium]